MPEQEAEKGFPKVEGLGGGLLNEIYGTPGKPDNGTNRSQGGRPRLGFDLA